MIKKLTLIEEIILANTDKEYKYIARNKRRSLCLFVHKPQKLKKDGFWASKQGHCIGFYGFTNLFKSIKWKDEKPYKFR